MNPETAPGSGVTSEHPDRLDVQRHLAAAEAILGYHFQDQQLLQTALTHPSAAFEQPGSTGSYERLEFLGDAYLGAMISELLFQSFPDLEEGGLTRLKISLVSGETLATKAAELGLAEAIIFGSSEAGTGHRGLRSALENVFEALIAALVLDGGFARARVWVVQHLEDILDRDLVSHPDNPKSALQELMQEQHITPTYRLVATAGPAHNRVFTAEVLAGTQILGSGVGHSIKEAEVAAASSALAQMSDQNPDQNPPAGPELGVL